MTRSGMKYAGARDAKAGDRVSLPNGAPAIIVLPQIAPPDGVTVEMTLVWFPLNGQCGAVAVAELNIEKCVD